MAPTQLGSITFVCQSDILKVFLFWVSEYVVKLHYLCNIWLMRISSLVFQVSGNCKIDNCDKDLVWHKLNRLIFLLMVVESILEI